MNSVAAIVGVIKTIERSKIIDFNKISPSNYREFIVDINFEDCFRLLRVILDNIRYSSLDNERRLHRQKFIEIIKQKI